ncbi:phage recombination protein Bet [Desulfurobacterium sp.]
MPTAVEEKKDVKILVVEGKEFTLDDIEVYLRTCVDTKRVNVTREDIETFFAYCKAKGLNPWDVHFIKYKNEDKPVIVVSIHALLKRAEATGKLRGLEAGVIVKKDEDIEYRKGSLTLPGESLVGGWAKVWKEGIEKPFETAVSMSEYRRDNMPNWKKMPATMIRKVALAHCLREAFPNELAGIYAAEEEWEQEHTAGIEKSGEISLEEQQKEKPEEPVDKKTLKKLKLTARGFYGITKKGDAGHEEFLKDIKEKYGVLAPEALTQKEAEEFIAWMESKEEKEPLLLRG